MQWWFSINESEIRHATQDVSHIYAVMIAASLHVLNVDDIIYVKLMKTGDYNFTIHNGLWVNDVDLVLK